MNEAIVEKVKALIAAPSCYAGLKKIAEEYIAALGSDREKEAGRKLVAELEADVLLNRMQGKKHLARNRRRLMRHMPGK